MACTKCPRSQPGTEVAAGVRGHSRGRRSQPPPPVGGPAGQFLCFPQAQSSPRLLIQTTFICFPFVWAGSICISKENICVLLKWILRPIGYTEENKPSASGPCLWEAPLGLPRERGPRGHSRWGPSRLTCSLGPEGDLVHPPSSHIPSVKRGSWRDHNLTQQHRGKAATSIPRTPFSSAHRRESHFSVTGWPDVLFRVPRPSSKACRRAATSSPRPARSPGVRRRK